MANATQVALPTKDSDGVTGGWYKFEDKYLSPEVTYTGFPKTTTVKLGGRYVQTDRAVGVKIRLLEPDEDHDVWTCKKQHQERINLGEFHLDFSDVEVAYSFTSPQTHIWFCGYSLHMDCLESLTFSSYNATVTVLPEHILPFDMAPGNLKTEGEKGSTVEVTSDGKYYKRMEIDRTKAKGQKGKPSNEVLPFYSCAVPKIVDTLADRFRVEYIHTPQHLNDCDRKIRRIDAYDGTVEVSQYSHPSSHPPIYPPVKPHAIEAYISKGPPALPFKRGYNPSVVDCPKNVSDLKVSKRSGRRSKHRSNSAYYNDRVTLGYDYGQDNDLRLDVSAHRRMANLRNRYGDAGPGRYAGWGAHGSKATGIIPQGPRTGAQPLGAGHRGVSPYATGGPLATGGKHTTGGLAYHQGGAASARGYPNGTTTSYVEPHTVAFTNGTNGVGFGQRVAMLPPGALPRHNDTFSVGGNPLAYSASHRTGSPFGSRSSSEGFGDVAQQLPPNYIQTAVSRPVVSTSQAGRSPAARLAVAAAATPQSTGRVRRTESPGYASVRTPDLPIFSHVHSGLYPIEHYPADESQTAAERLSQLATSGDGQQKKRPRQKELKKHEPHHQDAPRPHHQDTRRTFYAV